jgi:hypothetical protein
MPNTPRGYSTLSDHLLSHPSENQFLPLPSRVRKRRKQEVKRKMFGNLRKGFRLLLRVLGDGDSVA